jgi:hypothetical protein
VSQRFATITADPLSRRREASPDAYGLHCAQCAISLKEPVSYDFRLHRWSWNGRSSAQVRQERLSDEHPISNYPAGFRMTRQGAVSVSIHAPWAIAAGCSPDARDDNTLASIVVWIDIPFGPDQVVYGGVTSSSRWKTLIGRLLLTSSFSLGHRALSRVIVRLFHPLRSVS